MSIFTKNVSLYFNNYIVLSPLFIRFYNNMYKQPNNILLSYLVLPLVLNNESKNWLLKSKKNSSIYTFTEIKNSKLSHQNLFGMDESIQKYKNVTNQCLQYCINNDWLEITSELSIISNVEIPNTIKSLEESYKASGKITNIFKELYIVDIYRILGVKKI